MGQKVTDRALLDRLNNASPALPTPPPKRIIAPPAPGRAIIPDPKSPAGVTEVAIPGTVLGASATNENTLDKDFSEDYLNWRVRGHQGDFLKAYTQLNRVANKLATSDMISGPVLGMVPETLKGFIAPDAIDYSEQIQEIAQTNLRKVLGGQFAEKEGDKLIARAFNPRLQENRNLNRVRLLANAIMSAARSKESAAQYYEENGSLEGWKGVLPTYESITRDAFPDESAPSTGVVTNTGAGHVRTPEQTARMNKYRDKAE